MGRTLRRSVRTKALAGACLVTLSGAGACKLFGGGSDSKEKDILVGNAKEGLLLGPSTPAGGVCAYRIKGTGVDLVATRVAESAADLGAFVAEVKERGKDVFPWLHALDGFTRSLLEGFAKEIEAAPASLALQDAPAGAGLGDAVPSNGTGNAVPGNGAVPPEAAGVEPGTSAAKELAKRVSAEKVLGVALENASCIDSLAGDESKREQCREGLHEQLLSALSSFGRLAARKTMELPAKALEAKVDALAREIDRNVLSPDTLTRKETSAQAARRLEGLYSDVRARAPREGAACEEANAVVARLGLRGSPPTSVSPVASASPTTGASMGGPTSATADPTATAGATGASTGKP